MLVMFMLPLYFCKKLKTMQTELSIHAHKSSI